MSQTARFRRADRVVLPRDYVRVRRRGRRVGSQNFAVSIAPREVDASTAETAKRTATAASDLGPGRRAVEPGDRRRSRLGLSVSRRVGNAVVRNRVKRAIREWFRNSREHLAEGVDIVVIARQGCAGRGVSEIARELNSLMDRHRGGARRETAPAAQQNRKPDRKRRASA